QDDERGAGGDVTLLRRPLRGISQPFSRWRFFGWPRIGNPRIQLLIDTFRRRARYRGTGIPIGLRLPTLSCRVFQNNRFSLAIPPRRATRLPAVSSPALSHQLHLL